MKNILKTVKNAELSFKGLNTKKICGNISQ